METGQAPWGHAERNRRVGCELPQVRVDYGDLCLQSMLARYREGYGLKGHRRKTAH